MAFIWNIHGQGIRWRFKNGFILGTYQLTNIKLYFDNSVRLMHRGIENVLNVF